MSERHQARCRVCGAEVGTLASVWPDEDEMPDVCGACIVGAAWVAADALHDSFGATKDELARAAGGARRTLERVLRQQGGQP